MKVGFFSFLGLCLTVGCANTISSGPVSVKVITPVAGKRCHNQIAPARLDTMESLALLQGKLGRVVLFNGDVDADPATLDSQVGFYSIDTQFISTSDGYVASDYRSLLGASLYYAAEVGYRLHSRLNPAADFLTKDPNFAAKTFIIADAHRTDTDGGPNVTDNAEYYPHRKADGSLLNYLISYPNVEVSEMPLGLNLGIMVHEYTHLVFQNLFPDYSNTDGPESDMGLAAIDEGLADYFGFLATNDPAFFVCSFPGENRDLAKAKPLTSAIRQSMADGVNYDSHEGGGVFAAANYLIGQAIGFEENGKLLSQMMSTLSSCSAVKSGAKYKFTLQTMAKCHVAAAGARASQVQEIYNEQYGGGI